MTTPTLAEALYDHWRSSSYELKRQPAYADAAPNLRRVFADQAAALEPIVEATVKNAVADALIAAAEDVRARGDIGKEDGTEAEDYLLFRARKVLADEVFEFPHGLSSDVRLAPAVNTFRRVMAREGVLTSIRPVHAAMIEALETADAATGPKRRSAMEAAEADSDAFAARRENLMRHLEERWAPMPFAPSTIGEADVSPTIEGLHFARFLQEGAESND
jgi:hypothetical protein